MNPSNYIADNPKMAEPPPYWLQRLYDFDADLVVLPSRERPFAYVLARRARRGAVALLKDLYTVHSDTGMCAAHGLVPVSLILRHSTASWSIDNILEDLRARDIWRAGGAEKANAIMDESDAKIEAAKKLKIRNDMYALSGEAWRSYQARTGQRSKVATLANGGKSARTPGSTAGSGSQRG